MASGLAGAALGGLRGFKHMGTTAGAAKTLGVGAGTGMLVNTAVTGAQNYKRNRREQDRKSDTYKAHFKSASVEDIPNYSMSQNPDVSCKTCEFYGSSTEMGAGVCNKYTADVKEDMVCSDWSVKRAMDKAASLYRKFLMGSK